jgi:hypothetical protein
MMRRSAGRWRWSGASGASRGGAVDADNRREWKTEEWGEKRETWEKIRWAPGGHASSRGGGR